MEHATSARSHAGTRLSALRRAVFFFPLGSRALGPSGHPPIRPLRLSRFRRCIYQNFLTDNLIEHGFSKSGKRLKIEIF